MDEQFTLLGALTIHDKVDFILSNIYPTERTWQTWLNYEWRYRDLVDSLIHFDHTHIDAKFAKSIYINTSPNLCLRHYIKLNSQLNGFTIPEFLISIEENCTNIKQYDMFTVGADAFFQEELPRKEYTEIINHFNLRCHYNEASIIHKRWYSLNRKAEGEIGKWYSDFYNL